ncbi:MAG: sigma-70 family RNA polymerase sigma factor [Dehalococcoidia bacterium]|jgi:RNA polymerase sigma-70 factor (ECF subfamily)|nr:sigma-70 family RNA polymerase sigma factor [Dehalococcoidia bacterium]
MPSLPKLFRSPADSVDDAARRLDQFAEKYQQFFPRVFAYVYGRIHNVHQTEDLVSEVFERAFLKMGSLRNDEAFATWLFTIARNIVTSHARKRGRESVVDPDILKSVVATTVSVENEVLIREEVAAVVECLKKFPQREQDIVSLKFDAELTNGQIAQVMGLGEANVRVILFRTLRKLRERMKSGSPAE